MSHHTPSVLTASMFAIILALTGCASTPPVNQPNQPLVIGERIHVRHAGDVITLPALHPPARVWYIVDDVGLLQWLGIDTTTGTPEQPATPILQ